VIAGLPFAWWVRATAAAVVVPPLVYLMPFDRLARWLGAGRAATAAGTSAHLDDGRLAAWVDRLQRRLPGPWRRTCLKRAAVLYYLLRRAGRPVTLCIGVKRAADRPFAAHAWLVRDGAPYLESEPDNAHAHTLIARFPDAPGLVP
jgi:hypothetical protein